MRNALVLARKEWTEISRDIYVVGIIVLVPLVMTASLAGFIVVNTSYFIHNADKVRDMVQQIPRGYVSGLAAFSDIQKLLLLPIKVIGVPFFLLVPLIVSGIVTADSFAGEKERSTLEALLIAPIEDRELFYGKVLTATGPSLLMSWLGFGVLTWLVADWVNPHFDHRVFPDWSWTMTMVLVLPAFVVFAVIAEILISSKVQSVKAASAINMVLTFPVLGAMMSQSTGYFLFDQENVWIIGGTLVLLDALLLWKGPRWIGRRSIFG